MAMNLLIAPNAFKGCLTALEVARAIARGIRGSGAQIKLLPIADGGDGLLEVLLAGCGGRKIVERVTGPNGKRVRSCFGLLADGKTAVVEMALASGMQLIPKKDLDVMQATTFGTGELIRAALRRGARKVLVGLGGSAANDAGAGMAQALGARFLDHRGRELPRGAAALERLQRIDRSQMPAGLRRVRFVGVSAVDNPLLGRRGSAPVYGPQKGATPAQVRRLERCLRQYARIVARDVGIAVGRVPGGAAAGGLGAGVVAFLNGRLEPAGGLDLPAAMPKCCTPWRR